MSDGNYLKSKYVALNFLLGVKNELELKRKSCRKKTSKNYLSLSKKIVALSDAHKVLLGNRKERREVLEYVADREFDFVDVRYFMTGRVSK